MANALTGDFDAVIEVSIPLVNRILAAQHQLTGDDQIYFHSVRMRLPGADEHGVRGMAEIQISTPTISLVETGPPQVVESGRVVIEGPPVVTEGPPLVDEGFFVDAPFLAGDLTPPFFVGGSRIVIHYQIMVRFLPGPGSVAAPQAIHGEVQASVNADQIVSVSEDVVTVDLGAAGVIVSFTPDAGAPLSPEERAVVRQVTSYVVRNAFEPANLLIQLPGGQDGFSVAHWRFKALPHESRPLVALLLNLRPNRVPSEAQREDFESRFLQAGDDFAIAIGRDYLVPALRSLIQQALATPIDPIPVSAGVSVFKTSTTYEIQAGKTPLVSLGSNRIRVTLFVTASANWPWPDFDITLTQRFELVPIGTSIKLQTIGDLEVTVDGKGVLGTIAELFKGQIENKIGSKAGPAIAGIVSDSQPLLDNMLSGVGDFLGELRIPPPQPSYDSVSINTQGLTVHGDINIGNWRPVVASFKSEPGPNSQLVMNALESWIPGGTIERFRWRMSGGGAAIAVEIDEQHAFTAVQPPLSSFLYGQWCLEVSGTRNGDNVVGSTTCGLVATEDLTVLGDGGQEPTGRLPLAAVDLNGNVLAHVDVSGSNRDSNGRPARPQSNLLIHFAGTEPASTLALLEPARPLLNDPERPLRVISVLQPGSLDGPRLAREAEALGVAMMWAEDFEKTWARAYGLEQSGEAILINPARRVAWRSEGKVVAHELALVLDERLEPVPLPAPRLIEIGVRNGERAPDFLFSYAGDARVALRTVRGRSLLLNFFTSWSRPCLEELQRLQAAYESLVRAGWLVLAINDGEDGYRARELFEAHDFPFHLVVDSERRIALQYGVRAWPATVTIDPQGNVRESHVGTVAALERGSDVSSAF